MPDERPQFGRFGQRDAPQPCASRDTRPHDCCPRCAPQVLRAYRVVRRYRGDQLARGFAVEGWCRLWPLQAGDVSWPPGRRS